jgi:hypothetical protein
MLAAVVVAACTDGSVDDDDSSTETTRADDDDDDGSPTSNPSGPSTSEGSETSSVTTSATTTETSTTDIDTGDSSSSTATIDDTSSSDDSTGDPPNEACVAGCMIEFGCQDTCECGTVWTGEAECVQWCDANLEEAELFSTFCRDAWEAVSACIGTLSCEQYHQFHNPDVPDYPCVSEADTLAFECEGQ